MESLQWVDETYAAKHKSEDPRTLRANYHENLSKYYSDQQPVSKSRKKSPWEGIEVFLARYGKKAILSVSIYVISHTPYIGKFVLPLVSFYTFDKAVGNKPAVFIFAAGLVLPKKYLIRFLQTYFGSRSMTRELVSTIGMTSETTLTLYSLSHTSADCTSVHSRRRSGFLREKVSCLGLDWDSSC